VGQGWQLRQLVSYVRLLARRTSQSRCPVLSRLKEMVRVKVVYAARSRSSSTLSLLRCPGGTDRVDSEGETSDVEGSDSESEDKNDCAVVQVRDCAVAQVRAVVQVTDSEDDEGGASHEGGASVKGHDCALVQVPDFSAVAGQDALHELVRLLQAMG
jgi:hypothetical protein